MYTHGGKRTLQTKDRFIEILNKVRKAVINVVKITKDEP